MGVVFLVEASPLGEGGTSSTLSPAFDIVSLSD
jgi:hypothetical protein